MKLRLKLSDLEDDIGIISVSCGTLVESGLSNGAVMMVDSIDPSSSPVFIIEYAMKHPGPKSHLFYHIATDGNNYSIIRFICIDCYCEDKNACASDNPVPSKKQAYDAISEFLVSKEL